jgi:uncharacterized protein
MKHFILFYDYVSDYLERRTAYRAAHFAHVKPYLERDEMFLAGACTDEGPPIGVLVFKADNRAVPEAFAETDPYVLNGVVQSWRVREWTTVAGRAALTKV